MTALPPEASEAIRSLEEAFRSGRADALPLLGLLSAGSLALQFACEPETSSVFLTWLRETFPGAGNLVTLTQLTDARDEFSQVIALIETVSGLVPQPPVAEG